MTLKQAGRLMIILSQCKSRLPLEVGQSYEVNDDDDEIGSFCVCVRNLFSHKEQNPI